MNRPSSSLSQRDQDLIWHPFTQMKTAGFNLPVVRGEGALLFDETNRPYIDAIGSWWVNLHGHAHPHIAHCVAEQAKTLPHVMFAGMTHEPAVKLCERLRRWLPPHLKRFFFSDNGSTANEIALKMALQHRYLSDQAQGAAAKGIAYKVVAFEGSYHGDTFGAMAVGERDVFVKPFVPYLFDVIYIPAPTKGNESKSLEAMRKALESENVAAFIFEPLIQAAFGMQTHEPAALDSLVKLCREKKVFTIADEVMTGFFKTGTCFAIEQLKQTVDFICLSKALTGGTLPLALTVTTEQIYDAFYDDDKSKAFFHGHSYTGNPLGCVAAIASLDLIESPGFSRTQGRVVKYLESKAVEYRKAINGNNSRFSAVRQKGLMLALDIKVARKEGYLSGLGPKICQAMLKRGVLIRPLGEVVYVVPPVCITNQQLDKVFRVIHEVVEEVTA